MSFNIPIGVRGPQAFPLRPDYRTVTGTWQGWFVRGEEGIDGLMKWEFTQLVTLTATSNQTISLNFPLPEARKYAIQLNECDSTADDATAKDLSIRMFSGSDPGAYVNIKTVTSDTNISLVNLLQDVFYINPTRLDFIFNNTTNGKKATLKVIVKEA